MSTAITDDSWKKAASAAAGVEMVEIEKAFAQQAYALVTVNGKPLLKPEYRVGFEIVHANDNLSRLVGIWVCRVGKDKYYIPVFFINGNVKGGLLYRFNEKRMVPLTNDWCEYLVSLSQAPQGEGIPISDRRTFRNQMNLIDIVEPPLYRGSSMRKMAAKGWVRKGLEHIGMPTITSHEEAEALRKKPNRTENEDTVLKTWDSASEKGLGGVPKKPSVEKKAEFEYPNSEIRKTASFGDTADKVDGNMEQWLDSIKLPESPDNSILYHFIQQDGGFNSIGKIATAVKKNHEFAEALTLLCKPEDFMPELEVIEKKAFVPKPILTWHQGLLTNPNVKSITPEDLAKGYRIEDFRKSASLEDLSEGPDSEKFKKEAHLSDIVFDTNTKDFSTVTVPGIYEVLLADGSMRKMLVANEERLDVSDKPYGHDYGIPRVYDGHLLEIIRHKMVLVDPESGESVCACVNKEQANGNIPMGKYVSDITAEVGKATPEKGKAYRIFNDKKKSFSEPFWVEDVKTSPGGLTEVYCSNDGYAGSSGFRVGQPILLNPDYSDYDRKSRVYGKHCVFVKMADKSEGEGSSKHREFLKDLPLGNHAAMNMLIFGQGYKISNVKKAATENHFLCHTNEIGKYSGELSRPAATLFLMVNCSMGEKTASAILDKVQVEKKASFFYLPLTKKATNLRFNEWPDMMESVNNEFNVNQQPYSNHILETQRDEQYLEPQRIGDRYSAETADSVKGPSDSADGQELDDKTPMQLAQMSQQSGNNALFDHAIVGSLTNTYDSMAMVDKWMPDLEKALDVLGRTLFLFYWKPEDFAKAYGTDDQSQLENKLVSNFKSFGDLIIEMLQKSKENQQGTVSLT